MAPIFWSQYHTVPHFCHRASAIDWACASWQAALNWLWTVTMYLSTCLAEVASHGGLCAPKDGEVKVNWELWPASKH